MPIEIWNWGFFQKLDKNIDEKTTDIPSNVIFENIRTVFIWQPTEHGLSMLRDALDRGRIDKVTDISMGFRGKAFRLMITRGKRRCPMTLSGEVSVEEIVAFEKEHSR